MKITSATFVLLATNSKAGSVQDGMLPGFSEYCLNLSGWPMT
jgi:hypothetical protein